MAAQRRRNVGARRRIDDEGEEDDALDVVGQEDDSLSDGSLVTDDEGGLDENDSVTLDEQADEAPQAAAKDHTIPPTKTSRGVSKSAKRASKKAAASQNNGARDTEMMMNGLSDAHKSADGEAVQYEDLQNNKGGETEVALPLVVQSSAQMDQPQESLIDRRRREHEEYKKKRDADPAFVPNRGAFFMHDHRHAGPAANGFRPFGRGRGRGRGAVGGPFAPMHLVPSLEPSSAAWEHDMHESVQDNQKQNYNHGQRQPMPQQSQFNQNIAQAPRGEAPNRELSSTKHVGNVQIRVLLPDMKEPIKFSPTAVNQYTRLPDHRPPLRRDKPVRISLPDHSPKYIFPAQERSFIFIPRALRPNQQGFGGRSRGRSGLSSFGAFSRRTSVFGGSAYGSAYSPSVAMSRRSSLAYEVAQDTTISPAGSIMSRPLLPGDVSRPIVRLPPASQEVSSQAPAPIVIDINQQQMLAQSTSESIDDLAQPQGYPLPQKPTFRENRTTTIPMHQPRPQKSVSVADIETPVALSFNPPQQQQQPFHQQVPQVNRNGYHNEPHLHPHSRNASYPSQASTGTPLSHIPERAIHAQPFQPNPYQQPGYYPTQYPVMPAQPAYYYPPHYSTAMAPQAAPFIPAPQQQQAYTSPAQVEGAGGAQQAPPQNLVAQEVNGMVYYYDAAQIPAVATFPAYPPPPPSTYQMNGLITPSPDGFFYPQPPPGVVYYQQ